MALTRIQIITEGLSQVGRTDLTSNARLWLNLFLDKIYKVQDWEWLIKSTNSLSISQGGITPTDYWKLKSMNVNVSSGSKAPVRGVEADEWALLQRSVASGVPSRVYIDKNIGTFNFWPTPDQTYSFDLMYYYLPVLPDPSTSGGDSASPKWGLHDDFLIRAIELKAQFYNDDTRYTQAEKILMEECIQAKMNSKDNQSGSSAMKLGKSFRRRFGRSYGNGF